MSELQVYIADDHRLVRESIAWVLGQFPERMLIRQAASFIELVRAIRKHGGRDLAIVDLRMPGTFTYPGQEQPALRNIDLKIKAGERVAILGGTGCGKSTLVKLLLRLYLPDDGAVYADGTDIRQIDPQNLRADIGYVAQDVSLFYGSLRENIVLGNPAVDDTSMLRASVVSGAENFISEMQYGYDTPIGENGRQLSGGQRQMITVARALASEPPVIIFDEPTSGMDNASEAGFIKRLNAALGSKTVVIVTHRQSLLALVDRIIVLDKGRVVADGPKQEVVNRLVSGQVRSARK